MQPIKFKVRCSKIGTIMTEPIGKSNYQKYLDALERLKALEARLDTFKDKNCKSALDIKNSKIPEAKALIGELDKIKNVKELSERCKTYLSEWIIEKKYGRKKEFTSKQTDKGISTEQAGFQLIQDVLYPGIFLPKSRGFYEDEFKTGNPDIEILDTVIDNKSSFTIFTFPFGETEITDKDYIGQLQGYMDLTKLPKARLCYTLNDTPFDIVDAELKSWAWRNKVEYDEFPEDKAYEIIKNHVFTREGLKIYNFILGRHDTSDFIEIPKEKRVVYFDLEKDEDFIFRVNQRSVECDQWVQANWDKF